MRELMFFGQLTTQKIGNKSVPKAEPQDKVFKKKAFINVKNKMGYRS